MDETIIVMRAKRVKKRKRHDRQMAAMRLHEVAEFFEPRLLSLPILASIAVFHERKVILHVRILGGFVTVVIKIQKIAAADEPRSNLFRGRQFALEWFSRREQEVAHIVEAIYENDFIELITSEECLLQYIDLTAGI